MATELKTGVKGNFQAQLDNIKQVIIEQQERITDLETQNEELTDRIETLEGA